MFIVNSNMIKINGKTGKRGFGMDFQKQPTRPKQMKSLNVIKTFDILLNYASRRLVRPHFWKVYKIFIDFLYRVCENGAGRDAGTLWYGRVI